MSGYSAGFARPARSGEDPEVFLPRYSTWLARTGLASTGYYRMQGSPGGSSANGGVRSDSSGGDPSLFATTTQVEFDYMADGHRGVFMNGAAGDTLAATGHEPGTASMINTVIFCAPTDVGAVALAGKFSSTFKCYSQIQADNAVSVVINDNNGHSSVAAGGVDQVVEYGLDKKYAFSWFVDRRAATYPAGNALRTRLSRYRSGVVGAEYTLDITSYTTLTGGSSPRHAYGGFAGVQFGDGTVFLGGLVFTGAQIEADGILARIHSYLGCE